MPIVDSYDTAVAFLVTRGKPVPRKKIANNTYVERRDANTIAVRLHDTDVVTYTPFTVRLDTGEWLTMTTASRMNDHLPAPWCVRSNRGTWELREGYGYQAAHTVTRFTDGITIAMLPVTGWYVVPETQLPHEDQFRQDRHNTSTKRLINRYIKGFTGADSIDSSRTPCILCATHQTVPHRPGSDRERVITIGDAMGDTQHLLDHMTAGHYPFQLLYAAVAERGYNADFCTGMPDITKRSLRTYLANRLYVGATAASHGKRPVLTGA